MLKTADETERRACAGEMLFNVFNEYLGFLDA